MDYQKWLDTDWSTSKEFSLFEEEMRADLEKQLAANELEILKFLPNNYCFGAVVVNADKSKFIHLVLPDIRDGKEWFNGITLRRMSSERDWKGEHLHVCSWDQVGIKASEYMGDAFNDEVL